MIAAAAAGAGSTITATLFGALIAFGLSAGTGWAALLEVTEEAAERAWRVAAWVTFVFGWSVVAVLLVQAPLEHLDALRALVTVLIAGGTALRVWRWHVHTYPAPGIACALGFALLALATIGGGTWLPVRDAATGISLACTLELFGTGMLWLGEGALLHGRQSVRGAEARLRAFHVMPMAGVLARARG